MSTRKKNVLLRNAFPRSSEIWGAFYYTGGLTLRFFHVFFFLLSTTIIVMFASFLFSMQIKRKQKKTGIQ
jgi:hypothetical protein